MKDHHHGGQPSIDILSSVVSLIEQGNPPSLKQGYHVNSILDSCAPKWFQANRVKIYDSLLVSRLEALSPHEVDAGQCFHCGP